MAEIHLLNVGKGDCTIFKSNSDRVTVIDICNGNSERKNEMQFSKSVLTEDSIPKIKGNFGMCKKPTNPLDFLEKMGVNNIFRFILTHPDMDHLDGFNNLLNNFNVYNFWDSGVRKDKPDFEGSPYKEEDWDRYYNIINKKEDITVISPKAGNKNKYFNSDDNNKGGDFLFIYAPDHNLVNDTNKNGDVNDGSYVVVYRSYGGRILIPGDAHDKTWQYVVDNYLDEIKNCEFMLAPHHGRDSNRNWNFLDKIKPKFSLLGCAASEHLAYKAWNDRGLEKMQQNQSGNVSLYPSDNGLEVYIENKSYIESLGKSTTITDDYGNYFLMTINKN